MLSFPHKPIFSSLQLISVKKRFHIQHLTNLDLVDDCENSPVQGAIGFKHRRFGIWNSSEFPGSLISSRAFPPQRRTKSETSSRNQGPGKVVDSVNAGNLRNDEN